MCMGKKCTKYIEKKIDIELRFDIKVMGLIAKGSYYKRKIKLKKKRIKISNKIR